MPFVLRQVTPISVCNQPISGDVDDELQAISNQALCGILGQLSSLVLHADGILGELMVQFQRLAARTEAIQARVQTLKLNCDGLDARSVVVPESDLTTCSRRMFCAVLSTPVETTGLFTEKTRPPGLQEMYSACQLNPVVTLRHLDPFRRDGMRSSKLFKCTPIMEKDCSASMLDIETRTPEELDFLPDWVPNSDILHPVHPDIRLHRINSSNQPVLRKLPTPNQLSIARSRLSCAEFVPTDTSGSAFQRLVQFRRSLTQISYAKQKQRRKSRKSRQNFDDSENLTAESTEKSFDTGVLLKCDTPTSTDSTNGNITANNKTKPGRNSRCRGDTDSGRGSRTSHRASSDPDSGRHRASSALASREFRQSLTGGRRAPGDDTDDASSAFSCDAEGYYTSFHCDSGLKWIDANADLSKLHVVSTGDQSPDENNKRSRKTPPPLPPPRSETTLLSSAIETACDTPEPGTDGTVQSEQTDKEQAESRDNEEVYDERARYVTTPLSRHHGLSSSRQNNEKNLLLTPTSSMSRSGKFDITTPGPIEYNANRTPRSKQIQHSLSMVSSGLKRRVSKRFFPREQDSCIGNIVTKFELDQLHSCSVDFSFIRPYENTQSVGEYGTVPVSVYDWNSTIINKTKFSTALRLLLFTSISLPLEHLTFCHISLTDRKYRKNLIDRESKRIADGIQLTYEALLQHYRCRKLTVSSFEPGKYVRQVSQQPMFARAVITPRRLAQLAGERPMCPIPIDSDQDSNKSGSSSDSVASEGALRPLPLLNGIEHYCRENCCQHSCNYNTGGSHAPITNFQRLLSVSDSVYAPRSFEAGKRRSSGLHNGRTTLSNSCPDSVEDSALLRNTHMKRLLDMIRLAQSSQFADDAYFSQDTIAEPICDSHSMSWSEPCLNRAIGDTIPIHAPFDLAATKVEALCSVQLDDLINHFSCLEDIAQSADCRNNGEGVISGEELHAIVLELNERTMKSNNSLQTVNNTIRPANERFRIYDHDDILSRKKGPNSLGVSNVEFNTSLQTISSDYQRCTSLPDLSREGGSFSPRGERSRAHTLPVLAVSVDDSYVCPVLLQYTPSPEFTRASYTSQTLIDNSEECDNDINGNRTGSSDHSRVDSNTGTNDEIALEMSDHYYNKSLRENNGTNLDEIIGEPINIDKGSNDISQSWRTEQKNVTEAENLQSIQSVANIRASESCTNFIAVQSRSTAGGSSSHTRGSKTPRAVIKRNNSYRLGVNNGE